MLASINGIFGAIADISTVTTPHHAVRQLQSCNNQLFLISQP